MLCNLKLDSWILEVSLVPSRTLLGLDNGFCGLASMGFCGLLRASVGFCKLLWASMGFHGLLWASDGRTDGRRDEVL